MTPKFITAIPMFLAVFSATAQIRDDIITLDKYIVEGVSTENTVVPSQQRFRSAYGSLLEILDTPRNVTFVSREQLNDINILDVRDFSKLTASSYTPSNFGAPATPSIRTLSADVLVNGIRRGLTSNGNGLPINFNAVESAAIVKGPATSVYGTSQYVGGYVDLQTKRPYFDQFHGVASTTVGMYDQYRWMLDFGGPISEKMAYRVSYSGEHSGSYYEFGKKNTQALYGALTWLKSDDWHIEFNGEYFQADYTENFGWNRPTQDLIDHGLYITNAGSDEEYTAYIAGLQGSANRVPLGPVVELSRKKRLLAPGDDSFGTQLSLQALSEYRVNPDFYIVNNTVFNYIDRDTFSSYHYSEVIKDNWSFDNRTEFQITADRDVFHFSSNSGVHFRYQRVEAYNSYYVEPSSAFDLTRDPETRRIPDSAIFWAQHVPGEEARGVLAHRYTDATNGETGLSKMFQMGLFTQDFFEINSRLTLSAGARLDILAIDYENPLVDQFDPGASSSKWADKTIHGLPNWNISPIYKITDFISWYATYNYSQTTGAGNGGGLVAPNIDKNGDFVAEGQTFNSTYLHRENELYESGLKFSLDENRIFITTALYHQSYIRPALGGGGLKTVVEGFEVETTYQPDKHFYINASYSYTDALEIPEFVASAGPFDIVAQDGYVYTPANVVFPGDLVEKQGTPKHLFNALTRYQWDNGFGLSANLVVTSEYNLSYATDAFATAPVFQPIETTTVVVPWQYTLDLQLFYRSERFDCSIMILNATDQKNYSPAHPVYSADSVVAELPMRVEGTVSYKF